MRALALCIGVLALWLTTSQRPAIAQEATGPISVMGHGAFLDRSGNQVIPRPAS